MPFLLVLYDTSYLMNHGSDQIAPYFPLSDDLQLIRAIPTEVKVELKGHFGDELKDSAARKGRGFVAKIMTDPGYEEVSLQGVKISNTLESLLGPDSEIDKKLIGFALEFLTKDSDNLAFIATRDGGIETEAAHLMTKKKVSIYTPASESILREIIAQKQFEIIKKRDAEIKESEKKLHSKIKNVGCGFGIFALVFLFVGLEIFGLAEIMGLWGLLIMAVTGVLGICMSIVPELFAKFWENFVADKSGD